MIDWLGARLIQLRMAFNMSTLEMAMGCFYVAAALFFVAMTVAFLAWALGGQMP